MNGVIRSGAYTLVSTGLARMGYRNQYQVHSSAREYIGFR